MPSSSVLNYGYSWIYGKFWRTKNAQSARNMQSLPLVTIFRRWNNFLSMLQIFSYIYKNMNTRSLLITIFILCSSFRFFKIFQKMWICLNILGLFITISSFCSNPRLLKTLLKIWISSNIFILLITIFIFYSRTRFFKIFRKIRICPSIRSLLIIIWKSLPNKRVRST